MAKLDARRLPGFLADPGNCRVVLLFGDDPGLVREYADTITRTVTEGDSLRLVEMPKDSARDTGALAAEAGTMALVGGRRLVRVRDAADGFTEATKKALAGPGPGLVLLEGGELPARSKLRALLEAAPQGVVIACYRERGAELSASIGRILKELGVAAQPTALDWLAQRLGDDRQILRRELEKLALYVGPGGTVTEEAVLAAVAEGSTLDLDEALLSATLGDLPRADEALEAAFAEGANPVQVVRAALRHVQRLAQAAAAMAEGAPPATAMAGLRPPVFFRSRAGFERALRLWRPSALEAAAEDLREAEKLTKSGSSARPIPDAAVARVAIQRIARRARAQIQAQRRG